jgi:hypothetical protein
MRPPLTIGARDDAMNEFLDRVVQALRNHRERTERSRHDAKGRESFRATCPAHEDRKPSLVVTWDASTGRVLLYCHAHCSRNSVRTALGLTWADLHDHAPHPTQPKRIVAEYDYCDLNGVVVGQKVRYDDKSFKWRHADPDAPRGWSKGWVAPAGPYRLPDLIDTRLVYVTEGEKSADVLWSFGLPATCGPNGAGSWKPEWSSVLHHYGCREVVVFADHDINGEAHAELVAASVRALEVPEPITVKVVLFPDVLKKGDVVDWLDVGHDEADLLARVDATPIWAPGQIAQGRLERRRQLTRERVARYRLRGVTQRMSVTQRMTVPADVTQRMSAAADVTRNAVTQAHAFYLHNKEGVETQRSRMEAMSGEPPTLMQRTLSQDTPPLAPSPSPPPPESPVAFTSARLERFDRRLNDEDAAARGLPR